MSNNLLHLPIYLIDICNNFHSDLKVDPALLQVGSSKTIAGYHHRRRQKSENLENEEETKNLLSDMNSNVNLRLSQSNHKTRYFDKTMSSNGLRVL